MNFRKLLQRLKKIFFISKLSCFVGHPVLQKLCNVTKKLVKLTGRIQ